MTDWPERLSKIRGAGFTLKALAKHTGIKAQKLYRLNIGLAVQSTPQEWENLDSFYKSLTQAGVIK